MRRLNWIRSIRRALYAWLIGLLIVTEACGGGSGTDFNNVTVSVSPATATIPSGGQVTLQATVNGLSSNPALNWTITELQTNGASGAQCNWLGSTPPSAPCPDGTIQGADTQPSLTVTYHSHQHRHVSYQCSVVFSQHSSNY